MHEMTTWLLRAGGRMPCRAVRRYCARRAAAKAWHWIALQRDGRDDPAVLVRLGLFARAVQAKAIDAAGARARQIALIAMGAGSFTDQTGWTAQERRIAAAIVAPDDADVALGLIAPDDVIAKAAIALAHGRVADAAALWRDTGDAESAVIASALAVHHARWHDTRAMVNAVFGRAGLDMPLNDGDTPFGLHELGEAMGLNSGTGAPAVDGPTVSVIMPCHNNAATLTMAARSIIAQRGVGVELIIVDDRSADDSATVASALAATNPSVVFVRNDRADGAYGARNTGILRATGEYLTFLDADDWSHPDRLARQIAALTNDGLASVARHFRMTDGGCPVAPRVFPMIRLCPITLLARRETIMQAGPMEEVRSGADAEYLGRFDALFGRRAVRRMREPLLVARWASGSISTDQADPMLGAARYDYRADWMLRHADGIAPVAAGAWTRNDDKGVYARDPDGQADRI